MTTAQERAVSARIAGWAHAVFTLGGLVVLGLLWPGALLDGGDLVLQAVAIPATLAWLGWLAVAPGARIEIADGVLRHRLGRASRVDLRRLAYVTLSPEAPPPERAAAGGYRTWGVALADTEGGSATFSVRPALWTQMPRILARVAEAAEASGAVVSRDNWAMLRREAGLDAASVPQSSPGWVEEFSFNRQNAALMAALGALVGLFPLAIVALRLLADRPFGPGSVVLTVLGVLGVALAIRDVRLARRMRILLRRDGGLEVDRRTGPGKLALTHEHVDVAHASLVEAVPMGSVGGEVYAWGIRIVDASGGAAQVPLGEGLVPPVAFWAQLVELIERSEAPVEADAHQQISRHIGRALRNPPA